MVTMRYAILISLVAGVRAELDDGRTFEVSKAGAKQVKVEAVERVARQVGRLAAYGGTSFVAAAVETYGGSVMVGTDGGVWKLSMKDGTTTQVAKTPPVEGITTDYVGYFVVTTAASLKRVTHRDRERIGGARPWQGRVRRAHALRAVTRPKDALRLRRP